MLNMDAPVGASTLGQQLHLTPRQVQYGLREVKSWLVQRQTEVRHVPGVGIQILCTPEQRQHLLRELSSQSRFQLILTPDQRQQLLALVLLLANEPRTLGQLQNDFEIARVTVLKDLDAATVWLAMFGLTVARRQHRGCWVAGSELARRQALAALLWGDVPHAQPLLSTTHRQGLVFTLAQDAALLPILSDLLRQLGGWDLPTAEATVATMERELGGRFTDESALQLALHIATQARRVRQQHYVAIAPEALGWLRTLPIWPLASREGVRLWPGLPPHVAEAETAALALQMLSSVRDEPWRKLGQQSGLVADMLAQFMADIGRAYSAPELADDQLLRDGLEAHILPACVRQRFGLWGTARATGEIQTERYAFERGVAARIAAQIAAETGVVLPPSAHDDLVLLLRAAIVRARPERARHVLVVCPSGMATTQLLVARLKARFPRFGTFEVLSIRELNAERIIGADLIITTVPLPIAGELPVEVLHVHPMLSPEDITALMQWMA